MASITKQRQNHRVPFLQALNLLSGWLYANRLVLCLFCLAAGSGLIYALGLVKFANLLTLYEKPRLTLYTLTQGVEDGLRRVILVFLVLAILYWLGWRLAGRLQGKRAWGVIIGGSLFFGILLLMVYPFGATDLFDNILRGRILGIYGENPFLPGTAKYSADPFYPYIGWKGWPSAYGPGWELTSSLVASLAGDGVIANVLAYKTLSGMFLLGSVGVVAVVLRELAPRQALAGVLLLAWNPVVLVETWGHGHNDIAMVFWMLLCVLAIFKQQYTLAVLALVVGTLFKFIPVLLIPPVLVLGARTQLTFRQRISFVVRTAILSALLFAIAYAPFWEGFKVFNVRGREGLYTSSLPSIVFNLLRTRGWTKMAASSLVSHSALALTLLFVLWQTWKVWKTPTFQETVRVSALILLFYLMVSCLWFQNWYSLWPIGLAPFLKPGPIRRLAVLFGFFALSKPLGIGPVLFWPRPELKQPWLEIWLTLGVMGIPWLYSIYHIWKAKHATASP